MKKLFFLILVFLCTGSFAQENIFQKVKEVLKKEYPDMVLENKLIMINVWSVSDVESREINIQMDKTVNVYQNAKLRGGPKGIIGVIVCKDTDEKLEEISVTKDKIVKLNNVKDTKKLKSADFNNIVYDSNGKEVYRNIPSSAVFKSIQQLITR
ncbi:MAG: hypothetical protein K0S32_4097 [Bacteroidetes bacterium]|jgi:hypothetical protein|nr:hypothetical protein [Bacteroidota bacterium]